MRSSRNIVPGIFCGATIEPGTFHLGSESERPFAGDTLARQASDGLSEREARAAAIGTPANIRQMRSAAPGDDTDGLIPPMGHCRILFPRQR